MTTTTSYRFRIELPDLPGALARVTDVLAEAGGNVESIDLHQPDGGVAVDEIGVAAEADWDMVRVAARIDELPETRVLLQRRERAAGDPVVNALRWAKVMLDAGPAGHDLELGRAILDVTGAAVAWCSGVAEARRCDVGRAALDAGGAVSERATSLPPGVESEVPPPYWVLAVADDPDEPRLVGFAARPVAVAFSASEVSRFEALLRLRRTLVAAAS